MKRWMGLTISVATGIAVAACGSTRSPATGSTAAVPTSPAPTASTSSAPAPSSSASALVTDVTTWPFVGDQQIANALPADAVVLAAFRPVLPTEWADPGALRVHWAGTSDSGQRIVLVTAVAGTHLIAGAWVTPASGTGRLVDAHDIVADAAQVSALVPSATDSAVGTAVVVGRPGIAKIMFLDPAAGSQWKAVEDAAAGRAVAFTIAIAKPFEPVVQILVLGPDLDPNHPLFVGPVGQGITFPDL